MSSLGNISDSNDKRYKANLAKKRAEAEAFLREQEQKERAERQARKEARIAEKARLEEKAQKLAEEDQRQKDLAHRLEADHIAAVEQQRHKNWMNKFQPPSSPPSDEEMNLLDYLPLTKRQRVRYLPQETPEACQRRQEVAREMGVPIVGRGSPCERCADFRILCIPQNLL